MPRTDSIGLLISSESRELLCKSLGEIIRVTKVAKDWQDKYRKILDKVESDSVLLSVTWSLDQYVTFIIKAGEREIIWTLEPSINGGFYISIKVRGEGFPPFGSVRTAHSYWGGEADIICDCSNKLLMNELGCKLLDFVRVKGIER